MKKVLIGCGAAFGLFLLLGACVGMMAAVGGSDPVAKTESPADDQGKEVAVEEPAEKETAKPKPKKKEEKPLPKPVTFEGRGDNVTKSFKVSQFTTFIAEHSGSRNFIVRLLDEDGNLVELVVNEIGRYKGKTFYQLPQGEYLLDVKADGKWSIAVDQGIPKAKDASTTLQGKGDDVVWVKLDAKLHRFTFTHSGQRNFIVKANGNVLLVNEIGKYSGTVVQQVKDATVYPISIKADGDWTMKVE